MKMPVLVDIMKDVVGEISTKLTPTLQPLIPGMTGIHFIHGHYKEIRDRLVIKSKGAQKFDRYPLICLFQDLPRRARSSDNLYATATVQMVILVHSTKQLNTEDRYEKTIKPFAYPIYEELLNQIATNGAFAVASKNKIDHTAIDRPHWGNPQQTNNESYIFNDVLDGIELRDLILPMRWLNC
jgi:hypothetical protein